MKCCSFSEKAVFLMLKDTKDGVIEYVEKMRLGARNLQERHYYLVIRDGQLVSDRELDIAVLRAMQRDHIVQDRLDRVLEGVLLPQTLCHLRKHR